MVMEMDIFDAISETGPEDIAALLDHVLFRYMQLFPQCSVSVLSIELFYLLSGLFFVYIDFDHYISTPLKYHIGSHYAHYCRSDECIHDENEGMAES